MPDYWQKLQSGQIWSSPAGTVGLGGVGREVNLGELGLDDPTAQQACLTLGLQNQTPGLTLGRGRIYAVVRYGIGAACQTVILDWATSNTIELPVGKVNVTAIQVDAKGNPALPMPAGYENPNNAETIDVPIILTASLSKGPRSSLGMPTLSQTINLAANTTVPWSVPRRAKRVMVGDIRGQAASDVSAFVIGALAANAYILANAADSAIRTEGVQIQGGADNVQLNSTNGWNGITLVWFLDG